MPTALVATAGYLAANAWWIAPTTAAIGAGVGVYSSYQSAKSSERIAGYNYAMQMQRARQEQQMTTVQANQMQQQARFQESQARMNAAMANAEAQARINNATSLRDQAEAQTAADRDNIRSSRDEHARLLATQNARAAKGNTVLGALSTRDITTESNTNFELALNEMHYQSDLVRRRGYGEAALEQFGGELTRAQGGLDLATGLAEASLQRSTAALKQAEGTSAYLMGQRQAEINRLSGMADAQGKKLQGWGTLISSASTAVAGMSGVSFNYKPTGTSTGTASNIINPYKSGYGYKSIA